MTKQISVSEQVYMYLDDKRGELSFNEVISACVSKGGAQCAFVDSARHLEALVQFFMAEPLRTEMLKNITTLKSQFNKGA